MNLKPYGPWLKGPCEHALGHVLGVFIITMLALLFSVVTSNPAGKIERTNECLPLVIRAAAAY